MEMEAFHHKSWRARPNISPATASTLKFRSGLWLIGLDLTSLIMGFGFAAYIRGVLLGPIDWIWPIIAIAPIYFLMALGFDAYDASNLLKARHGAMRGARALLAAVCTLILAAFCLKVSEEFPRALMALGTTASLVLLLILRYLFVRNMNWIIGGNPFNVVLLHDGASPLPTGHFTTVLIADERFDPDIHDPLMYDRLARTVSSADRVIVACAPEKRAAWAHVLKGTNILGEIFVPELRDLAPLGVSVCDRTPSVVVAVAPFGLYDRALKRAFDIFLSGIALFIFSPLLILVSILIKLDTPGPIIFKQVRIGCRNEMFRIWKFRSMRVEGSDSSGHRSASRDDDRITTIGRFLRSSSLDELPQLFNVLKGDMSIVGPRPHALGSRAAEKLFWEVDGRYWHRHSVKPGLTGLAQVRGFRGATLIEDDLRNRLQADLEYIEHWTIWRDIRIIILTFGVLSHRNAY
ncbi:exopolysaccharide biosynthesis polyprenyl glycosylphosphotransferase [Sphingomonas sp. IW22]|uniref:exopolysaccharide biosynthesis polyprenyl glycosylphosphotransferase n=1 Tax=Sphingomonas sp. IW22 TaxID=3242489 RepID=UPI0035217007